MTRSCLAFVCLYACLLPAAHGDFDSALAAYQKKDFGVAHLEFRRLAELGDAPSQRNLAAMFARGESVTQDLVTGWAWAALAGETDPEAASLRDTIGERLTAEESATAEQQRITIRASFGPEAVRARLMPVPAEREADCTVDVSSEARPLRRVAPSYPRYALRDDIEGDVCMRFYLARDGRPLHASIQSVTAHRRNQPSLDKHPRHAKAFAEASLRALKNSSFVRPATEALRDVPFEYCVTYSMVDYNRKEVEQIKQVVSEALEGKVKSQFELASITEIRSADPTLALSDRKRLKESAHALYLQSAVGGYGPSQFFVASRLLTGDQCEKDVGKGLIWLQLAGQQGHSEAQYLLASRLLYGEDVNPEPDKALHWLEVAAKGGHLRARTELARHWLLHAPERRAEALALLPAKPAPHDIAQLEVAALAAAFSGDFAQATDYQREVVAIAAELDLAVEDRRKRLAAFEAQKLPEGLTASPESGAP